MDLAYLPDRDVLSWDAVPTSVRVPILPHIESDDAQAILEHHESDAAAGGVQEPEHSTVMRPEIVTVTETMADGVHVDFDLGRHASAMSEVQDNHGTELSVDALTELTATVGKSARKLGESTMQKESTLKRVWSGFLDDLFGATGSNGTRAA